MSVASLLRRFFVDDPRSGPADRAARASVFDALDQLPQRGLEETTQAAAALALRGLCDWCVVTLEGKDSASRARIVAHPSRETRDTLERALNRDPLELNRRHLHAITDEVLTTGRSLVRRPAADWTLRFYGRNPAERYALEELTPGLIAVEPLVSRGAVVGAITFASMARSVDRETRQDQARFARELALLIDQRRQVVELERQREELYQAKLQVYSILDPDFGAVATADRNWEITYLNDAAAGLLGLRRDRHQGVTIQDALPRKAVGTPLWDLWVAALTRGEGGEARFVESWTGDGRWIEARAHPLTGGGAALYVRDITQEKQREKRLQQREQELLEVQKLESIGRLTGGVAHDFNNILMAINGHTELALRSIPDEHPSRESLDEVRASADRGAQLIRQLLAYSGRGKQQRRAVSLPEIVANLEASLLRLLGEDMELSVRSQWNVPPVHADPNQLEQIIMNLAVNARDAMHHGGRLRFDIEHVRALEPGVDGPGEPPADGWVVFSATDDGTGIPAHVLPHVFEPFFTTKSDRAGTGLGLSTVQGIVQQHGGAIAVDTEEDAGTTIRIYLPACEEAARAEVRRPATVTGDAGRPAAVDAPRSTDRTERPAASAPDTRGTILVAEDEQRVLTFVCASLRDQGYEVLEASNGAEALAVLKRHGGDVRLLVTDVVMPYMGGRELGAKLAESFPDIKVIYMSGYEENEISRNGDVPPDVVLIEKPFSSGQLLDTVHDVLAGATTALPCVA